MTADLDNLYERMLERISQLRQERTEHEEILAFYTKVLAAQREAQKEITVSEIDLPEEQIKLKVDEGFPLLERQSFPVDKDCAKKLFQELCQISLEENPAFPFSGPTFIRPWILSKGNGTGFSRKPRRKDPMSHRWIA